MLRVIDANSEEFVSIKQRYESIIQSKLSKYYSSSDEF